MILLGIRTSNIITTALLMVIPEALCFRNEKKWGQLIMLTLPLSEPLSTHMQRSTVTDGHFSPTVLVAQKELK